MNNSESHNETHNSEAQPHTEPSGLKGHLERLWSDVKKQSATSTFWLELFALIGLAVYASITGCQLHVMRGQLGEMRGSGIQTGQLILQATAQANAAKAQSEQAVAQTNKMEESLALTRELVKASQAQATTQEKQFELSRCERGACPWVFVAIEQLGPKPDAQITVQIHPTNNQGAMNVHLRIDWGYSPPTTNPPRRGDFKEIFVGDCPFTPDGCHVEKPLHKNLPLSGWKQFHIGRGKLYFWGRLTYDDNGGPQDKPFCQYLDWQTIEREIAPKQEVTSSTRYYKGGFITC